VSRRHTTNHSEQPQRAVWWLMSRARTRHHSERAVQADLASFRAGHLGRCAIGTFQSVSVRALPEVVARLRRAHPGVEISLFESGDQQELLGRLLDGSLDLSSMTGPPGEVDGIEIARHVCEERLGVRSAARSA